MSDRILVIALQNALEHGGKARAGAVMGKAMSLMPELKDDPEAASELVRGAVAMVNSMTSEQQDAELDKLGGPISTGTRKKSEGLPELKDRTENGVRMRFAPGPSGPLHLGHSRAAVVNDEYVKKYGGSFILRLEDTNPARIDPDAYGMIPEDLKWLGINVDEMFVQSDRFGIYIELAGELVNRGAAYVCTCDPDHWRDLKNDSRACPHRELPKEVQLENWSRMKEGDFDPGEASLMIKTDLEHPNPAVRDFVGMRILDISHPRTGGRFRIYPLYNLAVALDDHLMGCTHILRGNDHLNNTYRQEYVYDHMGWERPQFIHYGLVSIPDVVLKTSTIREELGKGRYSGWDDIRLGTLRALEARGIVPEAVRSLWVEVGIKPVDITFSWENLYSKNRSLIDGKSKRYFMVRGPIYVSVHTKKELTGRALLYPDPKRGRVECKNYRLEPEEGTVGIYLDREDRNMLKTGELIRLKDLCNIRITGEEPFTAIPCEGGLGEAREKGGAIVQWVEDPGEGCELFYPDGTRDAGLIENAALESAGRKEIVQLERVGFFRLYPGKAVRAWHTHN